jgi:integrase
MTNIRRRVLPSGAIRWQARASATVNGKRQYHARDFTTESAARSWAHAQGALIERRGVGGAKGTVAAYFERWLRWLGDSGTLQPKSHYEYGRHLHRLVHLIGGLKLSRITSYDLDQAYAHLLRRGGRNGQPLSPRSVHHCHRIVSSAFRQARRWKLLAENPATEASPPAPGKSPAKAPNRLQLAAYLEAARTTPYWSLILTALATGLRRGELLGLTWRDVDLEHNTVEVSQVMCEVGGRYWLRPKPKTPAGFRRIAIPPALGEELRQLRLRQKEERLAYGSAYRLDLDLVFCLPGGAPWQPNRLSRKIAPIARAAGLPLEVRALHGLRHAHASAMLAQGIPLKVTSERLGHSSIAITGDLYSHVDEALDRGAADAMERVLQPLLTQRERSS